MAVGVPHKYMQINTYERSKCYVQLIISQTKTPMEKQFHWLKIKLLFLHKYFQIILHTQNGFLLLCRNDSYICRTDFNKCRILIQNQVLSRLNLLC